MTVVDTGTVVVVVEVVVVVVDVVVTDVCVVGGIELEEGTSTLLVVLGGAVVPGVEDKKDVEVVVEAFIGSRFAFDVTTVVIVDPASNVEGFSSDCVPENKLSTRKTARLPILKPANDKSGLVDSVIFLLAGCGAAFP